MQAAGTGAHPSPGRIASILRSQDAWPKLESPIDLAHRLASQQRQLVDQSLPPAVGPYHSSAVSVMPVDKLLALRGGGGGSVDSQVSQLAERVSLLVAGVQKRCDNDKQDLEQQIDKLEARAEARLGSFEARLASWDQRPAAHDYAGDGAGRAIAAQSQALVLREARALIGTGLGEAQTQWRSEHSELRAEQREQLRQLEDLAESTRHAAARLEQAERVLGAQERSHRRLGEDLEAVMAREAGQAQSPPWFGQLEGAISALDRRLNEQQVATEVQLARLQVDSDGLRRRSEVMAGVREDLMQAVEAKLEQELSRLLEVGQLHGGGSASGGAVITGHELKDLARRVDDAEAKAAAQRVRVDAHDARFGNLGERIEAVCQQAAEHARQVCQAKAEEMFSEVDCQNRVLRKRIETLSELCEELMLRQVSVEATRATGSSGRSIGSKQQRAAGGLAYEAHAAGGGGGARLDGGLENLFSRLPSLAEEDGLAGSSLAALDQRLHGFRGY